MASAPQTSTTLDLWPYEEARRLAERVAGYEAGRAVVLRRNKKMIKGIKEKVLKGRRTSGRR